MANFNFCESSSPGLFLQVVQWRFVMQLEHQRHCSGPLRCMCWCSYSLALQTSSAVCCWPWAGAHRRESQCPASLWARRSARSARRSSRTSCWKSQRFSKVWVLIQCGWEKYRNISHRMLCLIFFFSYFVSQAHLCFGILSNTVVVHDRTDTVLACVPTLTQVTIVDLSVKIIINTQTQIWVDFKL